MRRKLLGWALTTAVAALAGTPAQAAIAVGARIGTLGVGFDLTSRVTDSLNIRASFHPIPSYTFSGSDDELDYDFKLKMNTLGGLLDFHPGGGGFRLSGGLIFNKNKLTATAVPTATFDVGNHTYSAAQVGSLVGNVDFKKTAPYAGIGFGNAVSDKKIGVVFDLGVLIQGSPRVSLAASGPIASNATFQQDLAIEQGDLQDDIDPIKYYPMVSIGLTYKF
jgi:hypothetical protein